jgi:hypothetical protein
VTYSAKNDFGVAWQLFRRHWRVMVVAELAMVALWVTLEASVVAVARLAVAVNVVTVGIAINLALHVIFMIVFSGVVVGLHRIALEAVDGSVPRLALLRRSLAVGPVYLMASVLYGIAVLAGTVVLILPGIYVAVRLAFFGQILASRRATAFNALSASASLSAGVWWPLFLFFLIALVVNLLGAALLGVGFFVSFPVTLLAASKRFRGLLSQNPTQLLRDAT